jgi:hypothetical protein
MVLGLFDGPDVDVTTNKKDPQCAVKVTEKDTVEVKAESGRKIKIEETLTVCATAKKDGQSGEITSVEYSGKVVGGALQNLAAYASGDGIVAGGKTSAKLSNADGTLTKEDLRTALSGHGDLIKALGKEGVYHHTDKTNGGHDTTFLSDLAKAPKVVTAKSEGQGR